MEKGARLSSILADYYTTPEKMSKRKVLFAEHVGLEGWNGKSFTNEEEWLQRYRSQLRSTIALMAYSVSSETFFKKCRLPFLIWCRRYEKVIKVDLLLRIFLKALKSL